MADYSLRRYYGKNSNSIEGCSVEFLLWCRGHNKIFVKADDYHHNHHHPAWVMPL